MGRARGAGGRTQEEPNIGEGDAKKYQCQRVVRWGVRIYGWMMGHTNLTRTGGGHLDLDVFKGDAVARLDMGINVLGLVGVLAVERVDQGADPPGRLLHVHGVSMQRQHVAVPHQHLNHHLPAVPHITVPDGRCRDQKRRLSRRNGPLVVW